ncbi:hypothetical protein AADG42_05620 [Ammonicoccus fulvus]|uniref:Uncharacterized protein n=1 Tax=Ammonicoccus fulvus TaxID=3138240 RepID=A0ABZ3FMA6_9ACTN
MSATAKQDQAEDATGGLLRRIGSGTLVVKDFTSILSMSRETRGQVLGALREVFDGSWTREVGVDGGRSLEWSGRITVVGAVTTAWDTHHSVVAAMGDRFLLCRVDSHAGRRAAGRQAISNTGREQAMHAELGEAVATVLAGMDTTAPELTDAEAEQLLAAADLVTLARTAVERDRNGNVTDAHAPEAPTRFGKMLGQVVRGGVAIGLERGDAMRLAIRCARDSVPPMRLAILDDVAAHPGASTADVRRRLQKPRASVDRELQALTMLGVLICDETEIMHAGRPAIRWHYTIAEHVDPAAIRPRGTGGPGGGGGGGEPDKGQGQGPEPDAMPEPYRENSSSGLVTTSPSPNKGVSDKSGTDPDSARTLTERTPVPDSSLPPHPPNKGVRGVSDKSGTACRIHGNELKPDACHACRTVADQAAAELDAMFS